MENEMKDKYRYDDSYELVYDEATGRFVCSYFAAGITKSDSREQADKKMAEREEHLDMLWGEER